MDYTDDACMTGFTLGQANRIKDQIRLFRGIEFAVDQPYGLPVAGMSESSCRVEGFPHWSA